MPRLYGFWLCAIEYAKCNDREVFETCQEERDDAWASLTDDEKQSYKLKAQEYNTKYGSDVCWRVHEELIAVKHWGEECKYDSSKCCTSAVPAPNVESEEEDWDEGVTYVIGTRWQPSIEEEGEASASWRGQVEDEEEEDAQANVEEERLIAAGQEEEDWTFEDDTLQETIYRRGEEYSLEEYFETIELDHPGYAHHRRQLLRALFRK